MKIIHRFLGGLKGAFVVLFCFLLFPLARLFLWHKRIWIVSEYGYEARDNGFSFYKYMRQQHPEVNCYYAIDYKSSDFLKVKELGNLINFGSFRHYVYWCAARYIISSKTQGFCPSYYLTLLRRKMHLWGKYVFLQHGITKDDQKFLYKKVAKIDLFICGAKPEFDDIKAHYGYNDDELTYSGFARFDNYFNIVPKNQILVMPTWRRYAANVEFKNTDFFKTWFGFINSNEINELLKKNNTIMYFYLHPYFKNHDRLFVTNCSNIRVVLFDECDFQKLILESKMFITDFSSLAFDFGYMRRPVIYYQFDEELYFKKHYIKGYFDYRKDGFGPVCNSFENVLFSIKSYICSDFTQDKTFNDNSIKFFPKYDNKNSERIFKAIQNMKK